MIQQEGNYNLWSQHPLASAALIQHILLSFHLVFEIKTALQHLDWMLWGLHSMGAGWLTAGAPDYHFSVFHC